MLSRLLISLCLLPIVATTFAQQWGWVDNSNGSSNFSFTSDVAIDSVRDVVYAVGYVDGNPNFPEIPNASYSGLKDGFLMKYNLNGSVIHGFLIGGTENDRIEGVAVDQFTGNVFVTGYVGNSVSNAVDLEGAAPGSPSAVSVNWGGQDAFVAMYNVFGQMVWYRILGGSDRDRGVDIAVNSIGVFVSGSYINTPGITSLPSAISANNVINNFVVALDKTDGSTIWDAVQGSEVDDHDWSAHNPYGVERIGITADDNGVYLVNHFFGNTYEIYNSSDVLVASVIDPNSSNEDFVVSAYSNTGAYNWSVLYNNVGAEINGLDITNDCDGVYVTGTLHDGSTTPGGTVISSNHDNVIISKLNKTNGNEIWLKEFDSNNNHDDYFMGLHADGYGNLYAVGRLRGSTFSSGTDFSFTGGASNQSEVMIAHYHTDGTFKSFEVLPSSNLSWGMSIATYKKEKYVVGGYYNSTINFGSIIPGVAFDNAFCALRELSDPFTYVSSSYGNQNFCQSELTALPTINDNLIAGGTFSGPPQVVFTNTSTGEIDLAASGTGGPFTIVYSGFPLSCSSTTYNYNIYVAAAPPATFTYAATQYCADDANPTPSSITTPGGTFSGPSGLSFVDTATGEVDLSGSTPGTYWLVYSTSGSCPVSDSVELTIDPVPNAGFNYASSSYCSGTGSELPSSIITPGGTFSASPSGLVINPSTGEVNLNTSTPGIYTIDYVVNGVSCQGTGSFVFTILPSEDATFTFAETNLCVAGTNVFPASIAQSGGSFSSSPGLTVMNSATGEVNPGTSTPGGPYQLYYTTSLGACADTDSLEFNISAPADATFSYPQSIYCTTDANPNPTTAASGIFSASTGLAINTATGVIDLAASTIGGPYTIQFVVTNGSCADSSTFDVTVVAADDATFTYATISFCPNDPNPVPNFIATSGGAFSGPTGVVVNPTTGEVDVSLSTVGGPYWIVYETSSAFCPDSDSVQVSIESIPDPTFAYVQSTYCFGGGMILPNILATPGGTFSGPAEVVFTNTTTGEIDLNASTIGGPYSIQYVTPATPCSATTTFNIVIGQNEDASFSYGATHFCNNEADPVPTSITISGGTFSGPTELVLNSTTGEIDVLSSVVGGPYWLVYTTPGPTCPGSDSIEVYIEEGPNASFSYSQTSFCEGLGSIVPSTIVTSGGTFSAPAEVVIDSSTGEIDLNASTPGGPYVIEYTVSNTYCQKTFTFDLTIVGQDGLISVQYSSDMFCTSDVNQIPVIDGLSGGTFTATSSLDIVDSTTGEISLSSSSVGGPYSIVYVTPGACPDSTEILISIYDLVTAYAGEDQELFFLFSTDLEGGIPTNSAGEWSTTSAASIFDPFDPGSGVSGLELGDNVFTWTVSNGICPSATDEVIINVQDIFIPQAVTPNNDGKNDFFELHSIDDVTCSLQIFNRWGQIVYENNSYQNEWYGQNMNGDELKGDTYFYTILIDDSISYEGFIVLKK
ncbi:MAG: gliding motility-associated C-terminal domain-containing protein [Crocinitomicaceae bacterium]